jgi:hypothetical protein
MPPGGKPANDTLAGRHSATLGLGYPERPYDAGLTTHSSRMKGASRYTYADALVDGVIVRHIDKRWPAFNASGGARLQQATRA